MYPSPDILQIRPQTICRIKQVHLNLYGLTCLKKVPDETENLKRYNFLTDADFAWLQEAKAALAYFVQKWLDFKEYLPPLCCI